MQNSIADKVQRWAGQETGDLDFNAIHAEIEYLITQRFDQYVPTIGPEPDFRTRFVNWLNNSGVSEEDQKLLFRLVPHIFFLGREEFIALQRAAFLGPVQRWLVDEIALAFTDPDRDSKLAAATGETWFCPITDSAHISDFYHANNLGGVEYRLEWRAVAKLTKGDSTMLRTHMADENFKRVVLIEDLVGSGSQMSDLYSLLADLPPTTKVLLVPLVVCPSGAEVGRDIASKLQHVSFQPVLELPEHSFVAEMPDPNEPNFFAELRGMLQRTYPVVSGGVPAHDAIQPYGPFGWRKTGALIVTSNNTPDNTLPVIQHKSDSWTPLFPRSSRL
jgi:hypothetical protein